MTADIQFYHLTTTALDRALPKLVEKVYKAGFRLLIKTATAVQAEQLSSLLWSYDPASFLPHGTDADGPPDDQPIYLSPDLAPANAATVALITDGSRVTADSPYARVLDLFDGTDESAVASARERWKSYQANGHAVSYIQQSETGAWVPK